MSDDEIHSLLENCTVYVCSNCQHINYYRLYDSTPSINQQLPLNFSNSNNQEDEMELWNVSKHHTLEETIGLFNQYEKDSFSIVHINIRSLSKIIFKLIDFVRQLGKQPDVITVSETKLKKTHQISYNISVCGYNFVHVDTDKNAGGVGLYIKNSIDFFVLSSLKLSIKNCENIWIELQLNKRKCAIGVVYRH